MDNLFVEGLHITVLGLGVVFIGLSLLVAFLLIINQILNTDTGGRRPAHAGDVSPGEAGPKGAEYDIAEEELVAAIVACLSCTETESGRIT